ncbi:MAG: flagellar hook assembly protein FlgD [Quisquiliibacterium sp.]
MSATPVSSAKLLGVSSYEEQQKTKSTSRNGEDMGKQDFLTLFTAQLKNQDPLDPVKNEAFVAQLAQFSQLEATTRMADSLETMTSSMQGERILTGAALIGRKVAAPDGLAQLVDGANVSGVLSIPEGASDVRLNVYDTQGRSVYTQQLGRQEPGEVVVRWDGNDQTGQRMPAGRYNVLATVDTFGTLTQVPITTPATVKSVSYSTVADGLVLELDDGSTVPLSQVKRVDG